MRQSLKLEKKNYGENLSGEFQMTGLLQDHLRLWSEQVRFLINYLYYRPWRKRMIYFISCIQTNIFVMRLIFWITRGQTFLTQSTHWTLSITCRKLKNGVIPLVLVSWNHLSTLRSYLEAKREHQGSSFTPSDVGI